MNKIIIIITSLFVVSTLKAQNVPYEKLDSISKEISKLQLEANGLIYDQNNYHYEISFPEENFRVTYYNKLASRAVYKKENGKELLYLTENIDLSKAIGLTSEINKDNLIVDKIFFPIGFLKTQIFENGKLINTINENSLPFFYKKTKNFERQFYLLFDICSTISIEKGLFTKSKLNEQKADFKLLHPDQFIKYYPNSLLSMEAEEIIENNSNKELNEYNRVYSFMDRLCQLYKFKRGLTEKEFINYNPEASKIIKPSKRTPYNGGHTLMYWRSNDRLGINTIDFTDGIVSRYEEMLVEEKGDKKSKSYFTELLNDVKTNIPASYFRHYINEDNDYQTLEIYDPKLKFEIKIDFFTSAKNTKYENSHIDINFQTNKLKT